MKTKKWVVAILVLLMAIMCAGFTACTDPKEETITPGPESGVYYYDAQNGEYTIELHDGNKVDFAVGDLNVTAKYTLAEGAFTFSDFSGTVTGTISATLSDDVLSFTYGGTSYRFLKKIDYTVTFSTDGGSSVSPATVVNGRTVARPSDPTKSGEVFVGWYTEGTFENVFTFDQPITKNTTLYARFVAPIEPEFTVKLDSNGGDPVSDVKTVGHKLFNLPEPTRSGYTFMGWWTSDYGKVDQLTAKYVDQEIEENVTLYAVWSGDGAAVSVTEKGVEWFVTRQGNINYTVTITPPEELELQPETFSTGTTTQAYDFASKPAGDYVVEVTFNGQTSKAYYRNRGLARVTVFTVEGSTVMWNAVKNATKYLLTVKCGTADHNHTDIELTETHWSFAECDMGANGIVFTVKAVAEGYVTSESEPYTFTRELSEVTGLAVDSSTDSVSWNAVQNATGYEVVVTIGSEEVYNDTITGLKLDLRYFGKGKVVVKVTPTAHGWVSPKAAEVNYDKARIATPQNVKLVGEELQWDEVDGAKSYEVVFNGKKETVTECSYKLNEEDFTGTANSIVVYAVGSTDAEKSLPTDALSISTGEMSEVTYAKGRAEWSAVFGASKYEVKINDGEPVEVEYNYYEVKSFPQSGKNTIYVRVKGAESENAWKSVEVEAYALKFDAQDGELVGTYYLADGDPIELPTTNRFGYTFSSWNTAPNGGGVPFTKQTFDKSDADTTLYAAWASNKYKVRFNVGDYSDDDIKETELSFGQNYKVPVPKSNNVIKAFSGWYSSYNDTIQGVIQYTNQNGDSRSALLVVPQEGKDYIEFFAVYKDIFAFKDSGENGLEVSKGAGIGYVTEVTIPAVYNGKNVTIVGSFADVTTLTKISIPNTVKTITLGSDAASFKGCAALTHIEMYTPEGIQNADVVYYSVDGVLFKYNTAANNRMEVAYYPYARKDTVYTIPSSILKSDNAYMGVSCIAAGAFLASSNNTLTPLGNLTEIRIPSTVNLIEAKAFQFYRNLATVTFLTEEESDVKEGVTAAEGLEIRKDAFGDSTSLARAYLKKIVFPKRLSKNPAEALLDFNQLAELEVEAGGNFYAENGVLYEDVKDTGKTGKTAIFYPHGKKDTDYTVPSDVTRIGEKAFMNVTTIKNVTIGGQVTYIGESAFEGCTGIATLEFKGQSSDSDLEIARRAFYGSREYISGGIVGHNYNNSLQSLVLPANCTKIGENAFGQMRALTKVEIKVDRNEEQKDGEDKKVTRSKADYATDAFVANEYNNKVSFVQIVFIAKEVGVLSVKDIFGGSVKKVEIQQGNPYYMTDEYGILFDVGMTELVFFPDSWDKGDYTLPEGVTKIQNGMFKDIKGLTGIIIHDGVERIGDDAFKNCTKLAKVTFGSENGKAKAVEAAQTLEIGQDAFYGCTSLTEVHLPERLKSIGSRAFGSCSQLKSIKIPKNVEMLGVNEDGVMSVFVGCNLFTDIEVEEGNTHYTSYNGLLYSVREITNVNGKGTKAEDNNGLITTTEGKYYVPHELLYCPYGKEGEIEVSGYIRKVAGNVFNDIDKITKVTFHDAIKTTDVVPATEGEDAEDGEGTTNKDSDTIEFTPGETSLDATFRDCGSLTEVHFPKGMKEMPVYLFWYCSKLEKFNVPNTVITMQPGIVGGNNASIKTITFEDGGTEALRIEDGVTKSATSGQASQSSVFGGITNLGEITFPERLTYVGKSAFYYNGGGTNSYPNSRVPKVTFKTPSNGHDDWKLELAEKAFYYASSLTEVALPNNLTKIGDSAFSYCSKLATLTIPGSVESIGNSAFASTKLTSITLTEGLQSIGNSAFASVSTLTGELKIPKSVTSIGSSAFAGTGFSSVKIEDGSLLTSIGNQAFNNCKSLTTFDFGTTETGLELGDSVFTSCTALTSFKFPKQIKKIGASIFSGLSGLTKVEFTDECQLESIGNLAFTKTGITEIKFPTSTATNGISLGQQLFKATTTLKTVHFSKDVASLAGTFSGSTVEKVTVDEKSTYFKADKDLPILYDGNGTSVVATYAEVKGQFSVKDGGVTINDRAFAGQSELTEITIPASVTKIGAHAFDGCINLKKVTITGGSTLQEIGHSAFYNCWALEEINLEQATHLQTLGDGDTSSAKDAYGIFQNAGIKASKPFKITLPNSSSLTTLGKFMFQNSNIGEIDMSKATSLTTIPVGSGSSSYDWQGGKVKWGVFGNCQNLSSVTLSKGLTFLGTNTFYGCVKLTSIDLSVCTNLKWLGNSATSEPKCNPSATSTSLSDSYSSNYLFENCTNLAKVKFPNSITHLGSYTFLGCNNLKTIEGLDQCKLTVVATHTFDGIGIETLRLDTEMVRPYMFANCPNLRTVTFGDKTKIPLYASNMFLNCTALTEIELKEDQIPTKGSGTSAAKYLPESFLNGCTNLTKVTLPDSIAEFGNSVFANCTSLKTIKLPTSIAYLGQKTFQNAGLTEIDLSKTALTLIGSSKTAGTTSSNVNVFDGCKDLKKVTFGSKITKLAGSVFINCTSLTKEGLGDISKITQIGNKCFSNTGFTSVNLKDFEKVTSWGSDVWLECQKLTNVIICGSFGASSVPSTMFKNCQNLTTVTSTSNGAAKFSKNFGSSMFEGCINLAKVDLSNVTSAQLGSSMFKNCEKLTEIKLPSSLTYLNTSTFLNCTALETIDLSSCSKLNRIASGATGNGASSCTTFDGCVKLREVKTTTGQITVVGQNAFRNCTALTTFDFSGVTDLGVNAFQNCVNITHVSLPAAFSEFRTTVGISAFTGCTGITEFRIDEKNTKFSTDDNGFVYTKDGEAKTLFTVIGKVASKEELNLNDETYKDLELTDGMFANLSIKKVILKDGTEKIPNFLFYGSGVEEIVIPASVTSVGVGAFAETSKLKTVTFEKTKTGEEEQELTFTKGATSWDAAKATTFSASAAIGAFEGSAITQITIPKRVNVLVAGMFRLSKLEKIEFEEGTQLTEIQQAVFGATPLKEIKIPETVTKLGVGAFGGTTGFTEIKADFFSKVTELGNELFEESSVTKVTVPGTVTTLGYMLFSGCENLTEAVFEDSAEGVERSLTANQEFKNCPKLKKVVFGEGFASVTTSCCLNCVELESVELPDSLVTLGSDAFSGCTKLMSIVVPENVTQIFAKAFLGWTKDQKVYFTQSRYNVSQLLGLAWLLDVNATVEFGYKPAQDAQN